MRHLRKFAGPERAGKTFQQSAPWQARRLHISIFRVREYVCLCPRVPCSVACSSQCRLSHGVLWSRRGHAWQPRRLPLSRPKDAHFRLEDYFESVAHASGRIQAFACAVGALSFLKRGDSEHARWESKGRGGTMVAAVWVRRWLLIPNILRQQGPLSGYVGVGGRASELVVSDVLQADLGFCAIGLSGHLEEPMMSICDLVGRLEHWPCSAFARRSRAA